MTKPLIYTSDIRKLQKKQTLSFDELSLLQQASLSESQIQQSCKRIFDNWLLENGFDGLFVHIDNGCKSGIAHKVRKKFEGVVAGFPDVMLLVGNKEGRATEIFIEFKRMGTPAKIKPSALQNDTQERLIKLGYEVFLINNTVYFRKIILDRVRNLLCVRV